MCQFKSGIILKNRIFIADYDSHSDMLEQLEIEDSYLNATKTFVRAELFPAGNEWWTSPDTWKMNVDQDAVPDWFELDRAKYETEFRVAVKEWWTSHVLIDQKIEELTNGYYRLMRCEVKKLLNDVKIALCHSSQVGEMWGSSQVGEMWGSSQVGEMWDSSQVGKMYGSSIARHYGKGKIFISPECDLAVTIFENPVKE